MKIGGSRLPCVRAPSETSVPRVGVADLERVVARAKVGRLEHERLSGEIEPRDGVERVDVGRDSRQRRVRQFPLVADVVQGRARRTSAGAGRTGHRGS